MFPEWERRTLGDLFSISAGGDLNKEESSSIKTALFPYPVYANARINNGLHSFANYYVISGNSFTVTGRGDVGYAVARHDKYVPIVRLLVCKPLHSENVDFFAELINQTHIFVESTGVPQLTVPQLSALFVSVPSLPEQQKIASLLSSVDETITLCRRKLDLLSQAKKALMQQIFSRKLRFTADDGSEFPEWEEVKLRRCGKFTSGSAFNEKYQGYSNMPINFYKVSDMNNSANLTVMTYANNTVNDELVKQMKATVIYEPSIIFAKVGAAIFRERKRMALKPFVIDNNLMAFSPNGSIDLTFLYYSFNAIRFSKLAQVGALPSYNASDLGSLLIGLPSLPEQHKIASCLSSTDELIDQARVELEQWQEVKKSLLQQLFV